LTAILIIIYFRLSGILKKSDWKCFIIN
jgi:hypothetical protein